MNLMLGRLTLKASTHSMRERMLVHQIWLDGHALLIQTKTVEELSRWIYISCPCEVKAR